MYLLIFELSMQLMSSVSQLTDQLKLRDMGNDNSECLKTYNGYEYNGTMSHGKDGDPCLAWDMFGENETHNYCRNYMHLDAPWCFIKLPFKSSYCNIPMCKQHLECKTSQKGMEYVGTESRSASGEKCLFWYELNITAEENYCRNVDGENIVPWCYVEVCTEDKCQPEQQICSIPYCGTVNCKTSRKGLDYNGTVSYTASGKTCLFWHKLNITAEDNYCRNIDGKRSFPWCFTHITCHGNKCVPYWGFCNVPYCDSVQIDRRECKKTMRGLEYAGKLSRTTTGKHCLPWKQISSSSYTHGKYDYEFPENNITEAKSYCRNTLGSELQSKLSPWCYISSLSSITKGYFEYCDVPFCNNIINHTKQCRDTPDGLDYTGTLSKTIEGYTCKKWVHQYKNENHFVQKNGLGYQFPENDVIEAENYCRNPDFDSYGPWCFTDIGKQHCLIPMCNEPTWTNDVDCKINNQGKNYKGKINITISGDICWPWMFNNEKLHKLHKDVSEDLNYCRNMDNDKIGPWCFYKPLIQPVDGKSLYKKQYCPIPICSLEKKLNKIYIENVDKTHLKTHSWIASRNILLIICPFFLILGTILNSLAMLVFKLPILQGNTTAFLLFILAIFDLLSLYMGALFRWMRIISGWYIEATNLATCMIYSYAQGIVTSTSAWLLPTITLERLVAISKPFYAKLICTKYNAIKALAYILFFQMLLNTPKLFYTIPWYQIVFEINGINLTVNPKCVIINQIVGWIDFTARCLIPFVILLIGNIIIILCMYNQNKTRHTLSPYSNAVENRPGLKFISTLLLTSSFTYMFLTLPYIVYIVTIPFVTVLQQAHVKSFEKHQVRYIDYKVGGVSDEEDPYKGDLYFVIAISIMYISNWINFFLYCVGGRTFRHLFLNMISCKQSNQNKQNRL